MRLAHSVADVRAAEGRLLAALPDGALMQRAAFGLATTCADLLGGGYGTRVALLVGSGDNGGDALFAGAQLARRGARVDAVLLSPDRTHSGGLAALLASGGRVTDSPEAMLEAADLVLDGIVGIGGRGGLRPEAASYASLLAEAGVPVVAVDVPSGVDADTGVVEGAAIQATVTVTFGTHKPGLLVDPGAGYAGVVRLVDIGLELPAPAVESLQLADVAALLPQPTRESDKYRRGVLGVACGSPRYPGAAVLVTGSAMRSGVGAVRYCGPVSASVGERWPEVLRSEGSIAEAGRVQAWVVGPGIDTHLMSADLVREVLAEDVPVLVDADGLTVLSRYGRDWLKSRNAPTLLTPHAGEASRLLGVERDWVEEHRLEAARRLASEWGASVLVKGSTTVVAGPDGGAVRVNSTGTPALATAGSGDVLSGLAGGLLAAGLEPVDALSVGAYLHGLAARQLPEPLVASDLIAELPEVTAEVLDEGQRGPAGL